MKKNISINIGGIIFHIEEDAYPTLQSYLAGISTFFSKYEDSQEIISDIEARIAEHFLENLSEDKQVIILEDIDRLIATMGKVEDFEVMEEGADFSEYENTTDQTDMGGSEDSREKQSQPNHSRRAYRDLDNKVLGGVCSGLAQYFRIDPLWIRVAFVVILLTGFSFTLGSPGNFIWNLGMALPVYVILWIVLPGKTNLEHKKSVRRFYRNPDERVLGGVASGLALYFNTDILLIRILFLIATFGFGFGFLAYIILWIAAPSAVSLTDKMKMKGKAVTLTNIKSSVNETKEQTSDPKDENTITRIILFPFRLIGQIVRGAGKILKPILLFFVAFVRIITGFCLSLVGLSAMVSFVIIAGVAINLYHSDWFYDWLHIGDDGVFWLLMMSKTVASEAEVIAALVIGFIPMLFIFLVGATLITQRKIINKSLGWSLLGAWLIAFFILAANAGTAWKDFRKGGESYVEQTLIKPQPQDTLVFSYQQLSHHLFSINNNLNFVREFEDEFMDMDIEASDDSLVMLKGNVYARGRNKAEADANAELIQYTPEVNGHEILFDSFYTLPDEVPFRFQEYFFTLYIPKKQPFRMESNMRYLISYLPTYASWRYIDQKVFIFDEDGKMVCTSCEKPRDD